MFVKSRAVIFATLVALVWATPGRMTAGAAAPSPNVTLNYRNVDVREIAKNLLGDTLGLKYAVDPGAQGAVTVEAAKPVPRTDVLPLLESDLVAAGLSLVRRGDVYTIVPLEDARTRSPIVTAHDPGFGAQPVRLRYVGAPYLKKLLDPVVPRGAIAAGSTGTDILIISGTEQERKSVLALIRQFDINSLHGMSFDLLTPKHVDAHSLLPQLEAALNSSGLPTAGAVKFLSVKSLNAILAISTQPGYLPEIRKWVELLDSQGSENDRKLFVYHVQNGRAVDLTAVLIPAFTVPAKMFEAQTVRVAAPPAQPPPPRFRPPYVPPQRPGIPPGLNRFLNSRNQAQQNSPAKTGTTRDQPNTASSPYGANLLWVPGGVNPITIAADPTNNAVLVYSTPRQYTFVADALRRLDLPPLRVLIEATIVEVTLDDALRYGVQWYFNKYSDSQVALSQGTTPAPLQILPGFSYLLSSGNTVTATLNALSSITDVRILSTPKVNVLSNHTAMLQVGAQVPITTGSAVSTLSSSAPILNQVQYKDTGVLLKVTPRVNKKGLVLLDISQEVNDVEPTVTSGIDSPTFSARKFASSIALQDNSTVAISGLIRDSSTQIKTGIPYLSEIPILGVLFGSTSKETKRTELIVFLTAHVEETTLEADAVTRELIEKIHAGAPPPPPISPVSL